MLYNSQVKNILYRQIIQYNIEMICDKWNNIMALLRLVINKDLQDNSLTCTSSQKKKLVNDPEIQNLYFIESIQGEFGTVDGN